MLVETNKHGYAKLYLQTEGTYSLMASGVSDVGSMYAIVISHGHHEEVLYEEVIAPTESYVHGPDPAQTEGKIFVLSQE